MKSASEFLSQTEKDDAAAALREAESRTSGEIVPVICTSSGRYDRAEDIVGVLVSLVALGVFWWFFQDVAVPAEDWATGPSVALGYWWIVLIVVAGFAFGAALATAIPSLRLPFVTSREMEEEVERRALEAFARFRVGRTAEGTGILIFVSLFEHRVVVEGDVTIASKLEQGDWDEVRDLILDGIRRGEPGAGLRAGILRCGELLAEHFPIRDDDANELVNEVQFLDWE